MHNTVALSFLSKVVYPHIGLQHHQRCPTAVLGLHVSCSDRPRVPSSQAQVTVLVGLHNSTAPSTCRLPCKASGGFPAYIHSNEGGTCRNPPLLQLWESKKRLFIRSCCAIWWGNEESTGSFQLPQKELTTFVYFTYWEKSYQWGSAVMCGMKINNTLQITVMLLLSWWIL